jgi:hypothetical protein
VEVCADARLAVRTITPDQPASLELLRRIFSGHRTSEECSDDCAGRTAEYHRVLDRLLASSVYSAAVAKVRAVLRRVVPCGCTCGAADDCAESAPEPCAYIAHRISVQFAEATAWYGVA